MKVFISWSGDTSKKLAVALKQWLPMVIQYAEPWVSDKDISAGDRWAQSIAGELESSNFGIICVTPENVGAEWILFEAGALSKSMLDAKVVPLLLGLELSDLKGPLAQFQAQKADENGLMEIIKSINKIAEKPAALEIVERLVPSLWSQFAEKIPDVSKIVPTKKQKRSEPEILEELVASVRGLSAQMRDYDSDLPDKERTSRRRQPRFLSKLPAFFDLLSDESGDPLTSLLLFAGFLREDFPWLAELLIEAHREIKNGGEKEAENAFKRLNHITKRLAHHPFGVELFGSARDAQMVFHELPMLLDMIFHRLRTTSRFRRNATQAKKEE